MTRRIGSFGWSYLRRRHAAAQPRDGLREGRSDLDLRGRQAADFEHARREDLHLRERLCDVRRHDADDLPAAAVQLDRLADDRLAAAEDRLPQLVAEDADGRAVARVFGRR